jgi:hypothetical protein
MIERTNFLGRELQIAELNRAARLENGEAHSFRYSTKDVARARASERLGENRPPISERQHAGGGQLFEFPRESSFIGEERRAEYRKSALCELLKSGIRVDETEPKQRGQELATKPGLFGLGLGDLLDGGEAAARKEMRE